MANTKKGTVLKLNGHVYRKGTKCKIGYRWFCLNPRCPAFLKLKPNDEIVVTNEEHNHPPRKQFKTMNMIQADKDAQALLVRSRNGNENLLYKQFAYRKQYEKLGKIRWVCSTMKYCRACVFSNEDLLVISASQDHCHEPPRYYNKVDITDDILKVSNKGSDSQDCLDDETERLKY